MELEHLLPQLIEKTEQNKLKWEPFANDRYGANLDNLRLVIWETVARGPEMLLNDNEGHELSRLSRTLLPADAGQQLQDLFDMARRKALRVDEALSTLKDKLDRL